MQDLASDLKDQAAFDAALESQGLPKAVPGSLAVAVPLGGAVDPAPLPPPPPPPLPDSGGAEGSAGGGMGLVAGAGGGGAAVLLVGAALFVYMRRRRAAGAKPFLPLSADHGFDALPIPSPAVRPPELRTPRTPATKTPVRDTEGKEMVRSSFVFPTPLLSSSQAARSRAAPRAPRVAADTRPGLWGR